MFNNQTMRTTRADARKADFSAIFRAINNDFRRYPGGARAIAEVIGINDSTLRNMFSEQTESMPSLWVFLSVLEQLHGQGSMNALCALANGRFMPFEEESEQEDCCCVLESISHFLAWASDATNALADGVLSRNEKAQLSAELDDVQNAILRLRKVLQ
ncbi:phage regulatory CII family protein [Suttonella ornithocola]|uniref:Phage regulatory protein CII (CP76) n=1 Tax=Suttonella ornithocola TaxID=279832 RepID=A0A380MU20_9GAMM|nr:phage regulatory CII family protein [Suttonella ornithocola]SUO95211.1 Uncharacterised protein [Suttonella ornithocola]